MSKEAIHTDKAPAAIGNAILDALRPFGVRHLDMPITAQKVWQALHSGDRGPED